MIVPDANLLLYAYNRRSPCQAKAASWWESCLNGDEPVGIPWVVILAFLRISTLPALGGLLPESIEAVRSWLAQPKVTILHPGYRHAETYFELLGQHVAGGNRTTDAHLAALCIEHQATLYTNDSDFDTFVNLSRKNPIQ